MEDFADDTIEFWQSRMRRDLSREDARQIAENVSGFFGVLLDWDAEHGKQQEVREQYRQVSPPSSELIDEFRTAVRDGEQ